MNVRDATTIFVLILVAVVARPELVAQAPPSQVSLPGENSSTARRLATIDRLLADEKWSDAVDEIVRVLHDAGDDLVPINANHAVQARRLCHSRLASLPLNALNLYRKREDNQAKKWWEQAQSTLDLALLRKIVDESFCSSFADRALDLLGDLAFERGDFAEAEYWWRLLIPSAFETVERRSKNRKPKPTDIEFPGPQISAARVRAKHILVQLFQGKRQNLAGEMQAFRTLHPDADGPIANRTGKIADILQALIQEPGYADYPLDYPPWPTFAGHPFRQWLIPKAPSPHLIATAAIPLPSQAPAKNVPTSITTPWQDARPLVYYPVIAGGQVLLANGHQVVSYEAQTGKLVGRYDLAEDIQQAGGDIGVEPAAGFCTSLTVTDDRVFARLGKPALVGIKDHVRNWGTSYLVCLDRKPGKADTLPRRWWVKAQEEGKDRLSFEGSPLVINGRVYITRIRVNGSEVATIVECYNAVSGYRFWRQEVSAIREMADGQVRSHHHLLTQAGPNVVYASHSGAVIALDAITGRRAWAVRYPSRGMQTGDGARSPRDLAPCLFADHSLFIGPADYDRILRLDAATGEKYWESATVEVVHLLGIAGDKLIFTTGPATAAIFSPMSFYGIQAVDAQTGKLLRDWVQPADGTALATFGRGFLTKNKVFWPTVHGLRILKVEDSQPDWDDYPFRVRLGDRVGNMAFGDGILAVANAKELRIFVASRGKGPTTMHKAGRSDD